MCGAYGVILSTINLIIHQREKKTKVKVKITKGVITNSAGKPSELMLLLSGSNVGQKTVTLCSYGYLLPNKKQLFPLNPHTTPRFPYELFPGKNCEIWTEIRGIAEDLKRSGFSGKIKLVGFYRDQLDITYKSKPYKFDIEYWAKHSENLKDQGGS